MTGKKILVLLIAIILGILPVFAQPARDTSADPGAAKEAAQDRNAIKINQVSDDEFTKAITTANDVELITVEAEKTEESDNASKQGEKK